MAARETVELPTWIVDEVLAPAHPTAFRLVVMLYRHGSQVTGAGGERRVYWRGSTIELARLIGVSKPHLLRAEHWLAERRFLTLHKRQDHNAPHAISAPYDRPSGNSLLPPSASIFDTYDDDLDPDPVSDQDRIKNTTTTRASSTKKAVTICNRLAAIGVSIPERWLDNYPHTRIETALAILDNTDPASITNPPGFLHTLVTSRQPLRKPPAPIPSADTFEAQTERFLAGPLGRFVKSGIERQ